jgi:hypothetical protein
MADQVATFGLDDREFRRGLAQIDSASRDMAAKMERSWSISGTRMGTTLLKGFGAFRMGTAMVRGSIDAVRDYAKLNDEAAASLDRIAASQRRFTTSLGRDLSGVLPIVEDLAKALERVDGRRVRGVNEIVDVFTMPGHGERVDNDRRSKEAATAARKFEDDHGFALRVREARSRGTAEGDREADLMEEGRRFAAEQKQLEKMLKNAVGTPDTGLITRAAQMSEMIHANTQEQIDRRAMERHARDQSGMGDEAVLRFRDQREAEQRRSDAMRSLATGSTTMHATVLRAEADQAEARALDLRRRGLHEQAEQEREIAHQKRRGAESLRLELELRDRLLEIGQLQGIDEEERAAAADEARRKFVQLRAALDLPMLEDLPGAGRSFPSRQIAAGIGGDLSRQVFSLGGGGSGGLDRQQLSEAKKQTETIAKVEKTLARIAGGLERNGLVALTSE